MQTWVFSFTTDKNCAVTELIYISQLVNVRETPPQKNRTLFTFFLMILMMNRPDGSLSFLLTLSKTLFLNREHDLFLKKNKQKNKTIYNKTTDRNDNTQRIFVYLFPNHKNFDFFLDLIPFLSRNFTSLWFADGAKKKHFILQLVSVLDPTFDYT